MAATSATSAAFRGRMAAASGTGASIARPISPKRPTSIRCADRKCDSSVVNGIFACYPVESFCEEEEQKGKHKQCQA